jgi:nitrogenase molybdenum-iron protein beta chain
MTVIAENPRYSCALGGALTTVSSFYRVIPVIHGGPGCGMMLYNGQNYIGGYSGHGYVSGAAVPSTNTYEKEIVFGAEDRLRQELRTTHEVMDADLYFVITGCTADIIGDDVAAIVSEFREKGVSVAYASTAGFKGTNYQGYELVWDSLLHDVIRESLRDEKLVNIFGILPPQDIFWQGNLEEITRLLRRLDVKVNTFFTQRQGLDAIRSSSGAALNLVFSPWLGENIVRTYQDLFGVPWLRYPGLPTGPTATSAWLRQVGELLKIESSIVEKVIAEEEREVYDSFDKAAMILTGFGYQHRLAIIGDSSTVTGLTKFFANDFSQIPALAVVTEEVPDEHHQNIRKELSNLEYGWLPEIVFASDSWSINQAVRNAGPSIILGSSLDKEIAKDLIVPHLSVSFPVTDRVVLNRSYAGYRGSVSLVEDFLAAGMTDL